MFVLFDKKVINYFYLQESVRQFLSSYLSRFSSLAGPLVTCGPVLSWLEVQPLTLFLIEPLLWWNIIAGGQPGQPVDSDGWQRHQHAGRCRSLRHQALLQASPGRDQLWGRRSKPNYHSVILILVLIFALNFLWGLLWKYKWRLCVVICHLVDWRNTFLRAKKYISLRQEISSHNIAPNLVLEDKGDAGSASHT